jgi:SAM-dependent methyltransferase
LADEKLHVTLIDNDPIMLSVCRQNSPGVLSESPDSPGIRVVQRDLGELAEATDLAIASHDWDLAFAVNVLYSIDEPEGLLEWALHVLRPGGELRLSEPRCDTDINAEKEAIVSEANEDPPREDYRADLNTVTQFNTSTLAPHLHRWTTGEMIDLLRRVGFRTVAYATEEVYAGQSMLISARK